MHINFGPRNTVQIDDARLVYCNFSGRGDKMNREGDRNFAVVIPDQEIADALMNETNEYGAGWNVKIKPPRDEDDSPFMYLKVKIKFSARGPKVFLISNGKKIALDEESISMLDHIEIERVDLDIRPYDDTFQGRGFRSAYLDVMYVTQKNDRFAERYAD